MNRGLSKQAPITPRQEQPTIPNTVYPDKLTVHCGRSKKFWALGKWVLSPGPVFFISNFWGIEKGFLLFYHSFFKKEIDKVRMVRKIWIVIIWFPIFWLPLCGSYPGRGAEEYLLDQWDTSKGLPSDTINSIVQTPDGYLWLATSKGLVRFDGIKFSIIPFAGKEELSPQGQPETFTLAVTREGTLWIGGTAGLSRYLNGQFKTFTTADGFSAKSVRCIALDMNENPWISFMTGYVGCFSNEKFTHFDASDGLVGDKINAIVEDSSGNLLFATREKGIFSFRESQFSRYPIPHLDDLQIITMYQDHNKNLWIGTTNGLLRFDGKDTARYGCSQGLSHEYIMAITEDRDQNLWIGTLKGLDRLKSKNERNQIFENILPDTVIFCIYEDREKSLWIGTDNSGLKRLKPSKFISYAVPKALQKETLISIFRDRESDIWIGSLSGKLFHLPKNTPIETITPPGIPGVGISAIAEDSKGNLWLGTISRGVLRKNQQRFTQFTTKDGLTDNLVTSVYKDTRGNLWFSTFAGVSILRNTRGFEPFTEQEGLLGKIVHNVCEDKAGNIWIAADQGVTVLQNGNTARHNIKYYLQGIPAVFIYEDSSPAKEEEPIFWITTNGFGLKRLKPKDGTYYSYTIQKGLITNSLYQVFEDWGIFWLTSNNGILSLSKKELNLLAMGSPDNIDCISLGIADGMLSTELHNELSRHSALLTGDGELWLVTKKGISILNLRKIPINKESPPVVIESALFDGRFLIIPQDNEKYRFKGVKKVEFRFTAPSFLSPEKIKFKYCLEGVQKKWVLLPAGQERVIRFKDMAPGDYTFRVIACNAEGIWNNTGASMAFTLKSSFLKSPLFYFLLLAFFLSLAVVGFIISRLYKKRSVRETVYKRATKKDKYAKEKENEESKKGDEPGSPPPSRDIALPSDFVRENIKKLTRLMEVEKVYRDDKLSLPSLAEMISIRRHQLSLILNEYMKTNFNDYINSYRLEEAKRILESTDAGEETITGIAIAVGFHSQTSFYKSFKEYTGMTPNRYRKEARRRHRL
jgi:ligand-binding sensor domain-containing protein/AraC-like DNA-binding protein